MFPWLHSEILSRLGGSACFHMNTFKFLHVFIEGCEISPDRDLVCFYRDLGQVGWLACHMNTFYIFYAFLKTGEISPKRASPVNRDSLPPYEQTLTFALHL